MSSLYFLQDYASPLSKITPFQKLPGSGEERKSLLINLRIVKPHKGLFLCHSQREASTRQANHLQNYCEELALSYIQAEQHSEHPHMAGFITQERLF